MTTQVIDSHLHCPRDGKRMVMIIGQDDSTGAGDMRATHQCLSCPYTEEDTAWTRPIKAARQRVAARLMAQRLAGWTHEIEYSTEPFPRSEFDEEVADA